MSLQILMNKTFYAFDTEISNELRPRSLYTLHFDNGNKFSSQYNVLNGEFDGIDGIHIRVSISGDFTGIHGFQFQWIFSNPSSRAYSRYLMIIMSVLVGYSLVAFCFALTLTPDGFTQISLVILGAAGVFSSNPLRPLLFDNSSENLWDTVLASLFVIGYRLFLMFQLDIVRGRVSTPGTPAVLFWVSFFIFYALVDATAAYETANRFDTSAIGNLVPIPSEDWRAVFSMVYIVLSLIYLLFAIVQSDGTNNRRLWFWGASLFVTNFLTFLCHVVSFEWPFAALTAAPKLVFASVHAAFASMAIYLLHSASESEYTVFDPAKAGENGLMLDIDDMVGRGGREKMEESSDEGDENESD
jgi:hypothetical protein